MIPTATPSTFSTPAAVPVRAGLTVQRSVTTQTGTTRPQVRLSVATQTEAAPAGLPARSARASSGNGSGNGAGGFGRPGPEIVGSLLDATGRQPMPHVRRDPDLLRIVLGLPAPGRPAPAPAPAPS